MTKVLRKGFVLMLLLTAGTTAVATPKYNVVDLGAYPGSTGSFALAINASGQVSGGSGLTDAFGYVSIDGTLFSGGSVTDLGGLGATFARSTFARAINANGQIAGDSIVSDANRQSHAFLWSAGTIFDLGTAPGAYASYGRGINDNGQVVGTNFYGTLADRAFIYTGGAMHDLGTLADPADSSTFSRAYGINNAGDVTGVSGTGSVAHPFLYRSGSLYDIGTLGGNLAGGYAINNNGQIAGYSTVAGGETHAFLYSNFVLQDLGTLPGRQSYAVALNDFGVAVGFSQSLTDETAFISAAGQLIELNSLIDPLAGWYISEATGINNAGQISATAGRVGDLTYQSFAVRLDPIIDTPVGGVPEPASWAMLIAGFSLIGTTLRRRQASLA